MDKDKIIIIKDGKVKEIEGKILYITEKAGFLDDTTKFDRYRRRIPDGVVAIEAHIYKNLDKQKE